MKIFSIIVRLVKLPFLVMKTLESIDNRLSTIENSARAVGSCVNNNNHRHRYSLRTGHWND
jgi:hypothetical protein